MRPFSGWTSSNLTLVNYTDVNTGKSVSFLSFFKGMKSAYYSRSYIRNLFMKEVLVSFYNKWGYVPTALEKYLPKVRTRKARVYERTLKRVHRRK